MTQPKVLVARVNNEIEVNVVLENDYNKSYTFKDLNSLINRTEELFHLAHETDGDDSSYFKDQAMALIYAFEQLTLGQQKRS